MPGKATAEFFLKLVGTCSYWLAFYFRRKLSCRRRSTTGWLLDKHILDCIEKLIGTFVAKLLVLAITVSSTTDRATGFADPVTKYESIYGFGDSPQEVIMISDEGAMRLETANGKSGAAFRQCYDNHLGCFAVGNYLTQGVRLPKRPDAVGTVTKLFTPLKPTEPLLLSYNRDTTLTGIFEFKHEISLKVLFHGFDQSGSSSWILDATAAFTKMGFYVLVVDWSKGQSFRDPRQSAADTAMVGRQAAALLLRLMKIYPGGVHPSRIHCIGFSMGAHAAAFCARTVYARTGQKIARVTGLDPASVFFEDHVGHLNATDAKFVDVIHSSAGKNLFRTKVGFTKPIGHVDFYPNGGITQQRCRFTFYPCSHQSAWRYFVYSITHPDCFLSWFCPGGYKEALQRKCPDPANARNRGRMGYYSDKAIGRGVQYVRTTASAPYC